MEAKILRIILATINTTTNTTSNPSFKLEAIDCPRGDTWSKCGFISIQEWGKFGEFGRITYQFHANSFETSMKFRGIDYMFQPFERGGIIQYDDRPAFQKFIDELTNHVANLKPLI